jgi:hypothetical protein
MHYSGWGSCFKARTLAVLKSGRLCPSIEIWVKLGGTGKGAVKRKNTSPIKIASFFLTAPLMGDAYIYF